MKQVKALRVVVTICLFVFVLFSANAYAAPVTTQEEFQSGLSKSKIVLRNNITLDSDYNSNIPILKLTIAGRSKGLILAGADVNSPVRFLTKEYNSADNLEFNLILKDNVTIEKFSLKEDESSEILGRGGAIYVNNSGNGESTFILNGKGNFVDNSVAGANKSILSLEEEETREVSFDNSGLGGVIYGNTLVFQDFVGDFGGNSALGGTMDTFIPTSGTLKIEINNSGLGGAIYGDNITLKNFTGNFIANSAVGIFIDLKTDESIMITLAKVIEGIFSPSDESDAAKREITDKFKVIMNESGLGGAIYGNVITLTEFRGDFDSNKALNRGGAIYGDTISIDNFKGDFKGNIAGSQNSYISYKISGLPEEIEEIEEYYAKMLALMLDPLLSDHSKLGFGGALYAVNDVKIKKFTGNFSDNMALNSGGAIYSDKITIENFMGEFRGNFAGSLGSSEDFAGLDFLSFFLTDSSEASGFGGALYAENSVDIKDFIGNFSDNLALNSGGAIYSDKITIENFMGEFRENAAGSVDESEYAAIIAMCQLLYGEESEPSGFGGALYAVNDVKIKNFIGNFRDNMALNSGGAIYSDKISIDNFKGNFIGNIAGIAGSSDYAALITVIPILMGKEMEPSGFGGALYAVNDVNVKDFMGKFSNNMALSSGGAIYGDKIIIDNFKGEFRENVAGNVATSEDFEFVVAMGVSQSNNKIGFGGALNAVTKVKIKDFTGNFNYNLALNSGGAISGENVSLDNFEGDFRGNTAGKADSSEYAEMIAIYKLMNNVESEPSGFGGALHAVNKVRIKNFKGSFIENLALNSGGAISGEVVVLDNFKGDFKGNNAGSIGSSLYSEYFELVKLMMGKDMPPTGFGGALHGKNIYIKDFVGNFNDNIALNSGGAIYGETVIINKFEGDFNENTAGIKSLSANSLGNLIGSENVEVLAIIQILLDSSGDSAGFGGALYADEKVKLKNFTGDFSGNRALNSGGAIYGDKIILSNFKGKFKGNVAGVESSIGNIEGIIESPEDLETIAYFKLIFGAESKPSGFGGAIYAGDVSVDDFTGSFNNNTAFDSGGAIYSKQITLNNFTGDFIGNIAGIESPKSDKNVYGNSMVYSLFFELLNILYGEESKPIGFGGAIYAENVSIDEFTGNFNKNKALNKGGAIYGDEITLSNLKGDFTGNTAGIESSNDNLGADVYSKLLDFLKIIYGKDSEPIGFGGALYSNEKVDINNFTGNFNYNTALNTGGAIYGDSITLHNFTGDFNGNVAGAEKPNDTIDSVFSATMAAFQVLASKESGESGLGGAIYGNSVEIENSTGNFNDNVALNSGGAIYARNVELTNFAGSFKSNTALGGNNNLAILLDEQVLKAVKEIFEMDTIEISNLGLGGAIYGNTITIEKFDGSFEGNSVLGGANASNDEGTKAYIHSSGRGGAIYLHATGDSYINGGSFKRNSASTYNVGDITSGLGGAIFFDVQKDDVNLYLTSYVDTPISFINNTHAPGGEANKTYNSIYFGTTNTGDEALNVTLSVDVAEGAYLAMQDPMASQGNMEYVDDKFYNTIDLNISKTGEGIWILGGYNDMQSKTTWTISEGTLQLSEDSDGNKAYIHLTDSDSSFFMDSNTDLLLEFTSNPHRIQGESIIIQSNIAPTDSNYANMEIGDTYTLLSLVSSDAENINVDEKLISESGEVSAGAFIYSYTDGILIDDSGDGFYAKNYLVTIGSKTFDPIKGGVDLLVAALATSTTEWMRSDMFFAKNTVNTWFKKENDIIKHANYTVKKSDYTLGMDLRITDNAVGGISGGMSKIFFDGRDISMEGNAVNLGIQAAIRVPYKIEIVVAGAAMETNYSYIRGTIEGTLYNRTFKAGIALTRGFELVEKLTLSPNLGYSYMNVLTGDVTERSESPLALHIDSHTENIHRVNVGATLTYGLFDKSQISLNAEYEGTFGDASVNANAYFANDSDKHYFETSSEKAIDSHAFKLGVEGKVCLGDKVMFIGNYLLKVGSNSVEHKGDFKFHVIW